MKTRKETRFQTETLEKKTEGRREKIQEKRVGFKNRSHSINICTSKQVRDLAKIMKTVADEGAGSNGW